jgi:hypothetical protein
MMAAFNFIELITESAELLIRINDIAFRSNSITARDLSIA